MKRIVSLLLVFVMLLGVLCSCNDTGEDVNIPSDDTNTLISEDKPNDGANKPSNEDEPSPPMENESNNDASNQDETVRDVPELGQLKLFSSRNLKTASIWVDQKGEFYIYLTEWDAYRQLKGLSSYNSLYFAPYEYESDNNIVVDSDTATVSIIYQYGKKDEPTIITYHFNRDNELVELHAVTLNIIASSEYDTFFVNMHSADRGYYFLTPRADGESDWRINEFPGWEVDERPTWPLLVFETTDGGKSWNQISTNTFDYTSDVINIFKFVSPQVGVISFRDFGGEDFYKRSYLTVDGGLTWCQMPKLPYLEWYSEIINFEYDKDCDCYRLIVDGYDNYIKCQFQFWSTDLINWSLIEP